MPATRLGTPLPPAELLASLSWIFSPPEPFLFFPSLPNALAGVQRHPLNLRFLGAQTPFFEGRGSLTFSGRPFPLLVFCSLISTLFWNGVTLHYYS